MKRISKTIALIVLLIVTIQYIKLSANNTQEELTDFEKSQNIVEIDNSNYLECHISNDKGDVSNTIANLSYEKLHISVEQYKNETVLDTEGCVWYYPRMPRAGGYQLYDSIPISGMNKGVLIDDKICLQSDGCIWSWEVDWLRDCEVIEHIVGYLPDELKASNVNKILKYDTYILILDNQGRCWSVYTYEKALELGLKNMQKAKLLFENIKDIGYGFAVDNQEKLHWFNIKEDGIQLHFIMDNIQQLASGKHDNLVLDNSGYVYYVGSLDDYTAIDCNKIYTELPFELDDLPIMKKIWNADPLIFPMAIGLDQDNNIYSVCIENQYNDEEKTFRHSVIANPLIIHDVKDFSFTWSDIIAHKNNGQSKAWFVYESFYHLFLQNQTIELEVEFKKVKATGDEESKNIKGSFMQMIEKDNLSAVVL